MAMQFLVLIAPMLLAVALSFGFVALWVFLRRRRARIDARRHPMKEPLLRPAGYSLARRCEDTLADAMISLLLIPLTLMFIFGSHTAQTAYFGHEETMQRLIINVAAALGLCVWLFRRTINQLNEHRNCRLGWEGELAVAEGLQPLASRGFRIFHDVPAKGFNIDHVAVGPTGVFAVETKTRIKRGKERDAHQVVYDGSKLRFPGYTTDKPIVQAKAQARWLRDFLSSAVGKSINVQPVLCIPGWWVDRKQRGEVAVQSAKACDRYFDGPHQQRVLDEQTIRMVAHQLEQKCRDVALGEKLL